MVAEVGKTSMWVAVACLGVERVQVAANPRLLGRALPLGRPLGGHRLLPLLPYPVPGGQGGVLLPKYGS